MKETMVRRPSGRTPIPTVSPTIERDEDRVGQVVPIRGRNRTTSVVVGSTPQEVRPLPPHERPDRIVRAGRRELLDKGHTMGDVLDTPDRTIRRAGLRRWLRGAGYTAAAGAGVALMINLPAAVGLVTKVAPDTERNELNSRYPTDSEACIVRGLGSQALLITMDTYFDGDETIRGAARKAGTIMEMDPDGEYGICHDTETGERRTMMPEHIPEEQLVSTQEFAELSNS